MILKEIRTRGEEKGVRIDDIAREEMPFSIPLPEIKTILESFVEEQRAHNKSMVEHNKRMDEHNKSMDEHNKRLEKILEKLAER